MGDAAPYDLLVRVIPRARRDTVDGERDGRLLVRVTAVPEGGRANRAVCRVVAEHLAVPPRRVSVVAGHRTRDKVLRISQE